MTDIKKFKITVIVGAALSVATLAYTVAQEYFIPDMEGYWQRKSRYERIIQNKGLSLHPGMHWKEKK